MATFLVAAFFLEALLFRGAAFFFGATFFAAIFFRGAALAFALAFAALRAGFAAAGGGTRALRGLPMTAVFTHVMGGSPSARRDQDVPPSAEP